MHNIRGDLLSLRGVTCTLIPLYISTLFFLGGCQNTDSAQSSAHDSLRQLAVKSEISSSSTQPLQKARWLFVGDSLTAGYGLSKDESYVHQLEQLLSRDGWTTQDQKLIELINAGISGDTSAGALRRIDWLLKDDVERVFLCIGANDGLIGQPIKQLRNHLTKIIQRIRARGAEVVLMGMKLPPNYGPLYTDRFAKLYAEVAQEHAVTFLPFLLEGVAGHTELNQADGIHPNREGQARITTHVFEFLRTQKLIRKSTYQ